MKSEHLLVQVGMGNKQNSNFNISISLTFTSAPGHNIDNKKYIQTTPLQCQSVAQYQQGRRHNTGPL
jgi:hypothetical protein